MLLCNLDPQTKNPVKQGTFCKSGLEKDKASAFPEE